MNSWARLKRYEQLGNAVYWLCLVAAVGTRDPRQYDVRRIGWPDHANVGGLREMVPPGGYNLWMRVARAQMHFSRLRKCGSSSPRRMAGQAAKRLTATGFRRGSIADARTAITSALPLTRLKIRINRSVSDMRTPP